MGVVTQINPSIPVIGQPDSTEEPKVATALTQLVATVNNLDGANIVDLSIQTADIANNAITAAKIEAQQAFQNLAISGTGLPSVNVRYWKDSLGVVNFAGDLVTATANGPDNQTIGTLPAGYRPGSTQWFWLGAGQPCTVSSAGVVTLVTFNGSGAGTKFLFGSIHFRAEN